MTLSCQWLTKVIYFDIDYTMCYFIVNRWYNLPQNYSKSLSSPKKIYRLLIVIKNLTLGCYNLYNNSIWFTWLVGLILRAFPSSYSFCVSTLPEQWVKWQTWYSAAVTFSGSSQHRVYNRVYAENMNDTTQASVRQRDGWKGERTRKGERKQEKLMR